MTIHDILYNTMAHKKVTQTMLAEKVGYHSQTGISALVATGRDLKISTIIRVLDALGYDLIVSERDGGDVYVVTAE